MLKALIFDVDGTLAETEELHRQAFNEAFAECGLDWHWDRALYKRLLRVAGGKERMRAYQDSLAPGSSPLAPDAIAELHRRKTERYGRLVAEGGLALRTGVARLIEDARGSGLVLAVATTTSRENVESLCLACWSRRASDLFSVIVAGDDVAAKKPAADAYELALAKLSLGPEACVAFEDSRNGMLAALGAGIGVHVVPSLYSQDDDFREADHLWLAMPGLLPVMAEDAFRRETPPGRQGAPAGARDEETRGSPGTSR